jgi:hypothetical protein
VAVVTTSPHPRILISLNRHAAEAVMKMKRTIDRLTGNEDGATLVFVGLLMVSLFLFMALAVDVGMMFSARAEAQRAADSAALAGASAFLDVPAPQREETAKTRGEDYATRNLMMRQPIAPEEVSISLVASANGATRVRAEVVREEVPMRFARLLNIPFVRIGAAAEAEALNASNANCLKPFALPDQKFGPDDWGKLVKIWVVGGEEHVLVGFNDNEPPGLGNIKDHIAAKCIDGNSAALGDNLLWEKPGSANPGQGGDGVGQVMNGMKELLDHPPLTWNDGPNGHVDGSFVQEDWASSKRVGNVVLYAGTEGKEPGTNQVEVVNFARVYFSHDENKGANPNEPYTVWGRIFPVDGQPGSCPGGECSENTFLLRLVK